MVRHIDIHAMDIVLYARAAPIFHGVHGTVYHDLRAEGIMAGHSDHTDRYLFAAGGKPLRIAAAALCAGAVMRHLYHQLIRAHKPQRFALGHSAFSSLELPPVVLRSSALDCPQSNSFRVFEF